ncbi:MAG: aminopeptidase, partial [Angelakisella sp.]
MKETKTDKSAGELLQEKLLMKPENMGITLSDQEIATAYQFCDGYKTFLNEGKTEREVVTYTIAMLEKAG